MYRSKFPYFFLALAAVLALTAFGLLINRSSNHPEARSQLSKKSSVAPPRSVQSHSDDRTFLLDDQPTSEPSDIENKLSPELPVIPLDHQPSLPLNSAAIFSSNEDPERLVTEVAKNLETANSDHLAQILGKKVGNPDTLGLLKILATEQPFKIIPENGIREVGELELNTLSRWALNFEGIEPGRRSIFLDLRKTNGKWSIDKLVVTPSPENPPPATLIVDSLSIADAFLQAVLHQQFEFARAFTDSKTLSDAKIAALCILFEEGKYQLRPTKPLRAMFHRGDTSGFLVNIQTPDASQIAQFTLTLRQTSTPANWLISEINLDELLADYSNRVASGDIYYSPLVKNPQGGDTLALYFEFDEDQINPRTRRQLEIVTQILRADPNKKITLSGHTDALGTVPYNNQLSARRAATVREFLVTAGVSPTQILTFAKGASQPRRPNMTATGQDDPVGRRANRRTEIYLDF